jgi:hypothetical protein
MTANACNNIVSRSFSSVNANYNVLASDYFILCTANSFDVTLPTAVGKQNKIYEIKNSGSGTIQLLPTGAEQIDGEGFQQILPGECLTVLSNNANWYVV